MELEQVLPAEAIERCDPTNLTYIDQHVDVFMLCNNAVGAPAKIRR